MEQQKDRQLAKKAVFTMLGFAFLVCSALSGYAAQFGDFTYVEYDTYVVITGFGKGATGDVTIPSEIGGKPVTSIASAPFNTCISLTGITIPDSITEIGHTAFSGCSSLVAITVEPDNPSYSSLDGVLFDKSQATLIQFPEGKAGAYTVPENVTSIGDEAFNSCTSLTSIRIPASVTSIGDSAFADCAGLTSVEIPDSVTTIKDSAFAECTSLAEVTISNLVTEIESGVFQGCTSLATVTIPDNVTRIGHAAFRNCSSLTSITIPDSVTSIEGSAFSFCTSLAEVTIPDRVTYIKTKTFFHCTSLTAVTIPDSITSIEKHAFYYCISLTSITIPDSVTSIGSSAFSYCTSLTSVTIPDSVTSIEHDTFAGCSGLTSVSIPDSVTSIGSAAFDYCISLTSITIPDSVTTIEPGPFANCFNLMAITVDGTNSAYSSVDGVLFDKSRGTLIQYPGGKVGAFAIPDSVTEIGHSAFSSCSGLTSVTIPDSVTSIGNEAFSSCRVLTSVIIPDSVTSIGHSAFDYCSGLTSVTIPDSVTSIEDRTFAVCSGLTSVSIPDSVTEIGSSAFSHCTSLTSVTIPDSITSIGNEAFASCSSLTSITIPDSVTSIENYTFFRCSGLTSVSIPDSVTEIGHSAFSSCSGLTSITLPDSVTEIGHTAFAGCSSLVAITVEPDSPSYSSIDGVLFDKSQATLIQFPEGKAGAYAIPDSVTSIGDSAFADCAGLTSITIPASVTNIGSWAFASCTGLTIVEIPDSVTTIGAGAFSSCTGLTSVTIPDNVETLGNGSGWGQSPFAGCSSLVAITVDPDNISYSSVDGVLFNKNLDFLEVYPGGRTGAYTIPDSVTHTGAGAFADCTGLTSITIPDNVETLGNGYAWVQAPFTGCSRLVGVTVEPDNPSYSSLDGVLFDKSQATLIQFPEGKAGAYTIPDSVTSVASYAFYECAGLTSVTIPDSVTSIGPGAFDNCTSLTSITIPASVKEIGSQQQDYSNVFRGCSRLMAITVEPDNPVGSSVDGVFFNKAQTKLEAYPAGKTGGYTIPDSVTTIGNSAFFQCADLTSVTIPASVTSIGYSALATCTNLTSIYFKGDAPHYAFWGVFDGTDNATVYYLAGTKGWGVTYAGLPTQAVAPFEILAHPVEQDAGTGGSVTFSVEANGPSAPTYQWRHEGVDIPGATEASFTIPCVQSFHRGSYTVKVGNAFGSVTSAVATLEVAPPLPGNGRLLNFSSRGYVGTGAEVMIPGFVVSDDARTFLIRAVGPALAGLGVTGVLDDPRLSVHREDASGDSPLPAMLLTNDNWGENGDAAMVAEVADQVGAFALQVGSRDAAFVVTLPSGIYTVVVSGADGGNGVVIVEIYAVPNP